MCRIWPWLFAGALAWTLTAHAATPLELKDGDRLVFLGDTILEREGDFGSIEARLTAAFADRQLTFRNLSWSADTPMGRSRASFDWGKRDADWLVRVKEQLGLVKPTVAILSYGMTAALEASEATSEDAAQRLDAHVRDLGELMDAVQDVSGEPVRFILLGPITRAPAAASDALDAVPAEQPELDRAIAEVNRRTARVAEGRGALFVDLLAADKAARDRTADRREPNGIHPNERGLQFVGRVLVRALGRSWDARPDDLSALGVLNAAVREKNEQFFHRWRPANWTYLFGFRKHEQGRNAVEIPRFEPLVEEWDQRITRLRNLRQQDPATVSEVRGRLEARTGVGANPAQNGTVPPSTPVAPAGSAHAPGPAGGQRIAVQPRPEFEVHPGFEVSLWAENPSLFKPIQINWDPQGRLWAASSRVYPQIAPGQAAEDAVVVLEDTDGDGRADKSTVFADGLLIPTGVVPDGQGGCYVAASHQLLHFQDLNGDGRADRRTIVLSSFGTEDTHHNLHTLRWGYDGHLYLNQSIYTHSHVETPYGVRRLNSAGIWRFDPERWRLEIFTKGGCNPWGHHWDQYGNHFFTDGAGFKGVYHAMEGATYFTYADMRREADSISPGSYPKFCSLEVIQSPAFPDDWQGQLVTCDFRAHRIVRFGLKETGSTFQTVELPDLMRSTQVTFRPIDLRLGPDGALYIADWSNPIIQHGEVDFRDPRRDKEHGRIWRVAARGTRPRRTSENALASASNRSLLDSTLSPSGWEQEQARVLLRHRGATTVLEEARAWLAAQSHPRAALEVLWLHEGFGRPAFDLVARLAAANDPRLRMAAAQALAEK